MQLELQDLQHMQNIKIADYQWKNQCYNLLPITQDY